METRNVTNLGRAITALGLEDKFLSGGGFNDFSLIDRGAIVNEIISKKLELGRWQDVIKMVYENSYNITSLLDKNNTPSQKEIIKSIGKIPIKRRDIDKETLETLKKSEKDTLIFKLATCLNLKYKKFIEVCERGNLSYFTGGEGEKRLRIFNKLAGRKALKEGEYSYAFHYFKNAKNKKGMKESFDIAIQKAGKCDGKTLENMTCGQSDNLKERNRTLKQIITKSKISSLDKFRLQQKFGIALTQKQQEKLYKQVAKNTDRYDYKKVLLHAEFDPELCHLWVREHTEDEPKAAYHGLKFSKKKSDIQFIIDAVISGLAIDSWPEENKELRLTTDEINPEHLIKAYPKSPFNVKVKIASYLKDNEKLRALSRKAGEKNLRESYDLWFKGKGDSENPFINEVRGKLIEKEIIKNDSPSTYFLHEEDLIGRELVYDALINKGTYRAIEEAYKLNIDSKSTQKARELMTKISPKWALIDFAGGDKDKIKDSEGVGYIVRVMSKKYSVDENTLKEFAERYRRTY